MAATSLAARPLTVTTPLGADVFLLAALRVSEEVSRLFEIELDVIASRDEKVPFEKLLGQPVVATIKGADDAVRHFHGICVRISAGERSARGQHFTLEVAPRAWLLTKCVQSRIFQAATVPDVLKKVFAGLDLDVRIQGTFQPRDYVAQYRESDFDFASRLMEEEGIYYYFLHAAGSHKMVLANTPQGHDEVGAPATVVYEHQAAETGDRKPDRVSSWEKTQELTSGKVTLWDHCFELPGKNLEAVAPILSGGVQAGTVEHKLAVGQNDKLELYDFPGGYAQRFDGVDKGGGDRAADIQKIFQDNKRTARLRIEEEAAGALEVEGESNCLQFSAGHKFTLANHHDADGAYVLTSVEHAATCDADGSGAGAAYAYSNSFTAIPAALPYRPECVTEEPVVQGSQTAVVVGPPGEEIFTDKYGRVKVQFHWDRQGKLDADSSCWVRVVSHWAGKQWGAVHIPRIGQEVVVDFLEGDPDQPIIVGSVYNAEQMPPYALPENKTQSGIKTRSTPNGGVENFNEICFEDKKGAELLYVRAEKDLTIAVENDESDWVGHDRETTIDHDETVAVKNNRTETVDKDETITIHGNRTETVDKDESVTVAGERKVSIGKAESLTVAEGLTVTVDKDETTKIGGARKVEIGKDEELTVGGARKTSIAKDDATTVDGKATLTAATELTLKCGAATLTLKKDGSIEIKGGASSVKIDNTGVTVKGMKVSVQADGIVDLKGAMVKVNGDGMVKLQGGVAMIN